MKWVRNAMEKENRVRVRQHEVGTKFGDFDFFVGAL